LWATESTVEASRSAAQVAGFPFAELQELIAIIVSAA
jgi:hypothetical protein